MRKAISSQYAKDFQKAYSNLRAADKAEARRNPRWRRDRNRAIRLDYRKQSAKGLAHEYGLSVRQIYRIVAGWQGFRVRHR